MEDLKWSRGVGGGGRSYRDNSFPGYTTGYGYSFLSDR